MSEKISNTKKTTEKVSQVSTADFIPNKEVANIIWPVLDTGKYSVNPSMMAIIIASK